MNPMAQAVKNHAVKGRARDAGSVLDRIWPRGSYPRPPYMPFPAPAPAPRLLPLSTKWVGRFHDCSAGHPDVTAVFCVWGALRRFDRLLAPQAATQSSPSKATIRESLSCHGSSRVCRPRRRHRRCLRRGHHRNRPNADHRLERFPADPQPLVDGMCHLPRSHLRTATEEKGVARGAEEMGAGEHHASRGDVRQWPIARGCGCLNLPCIGARRIGPICILSCLP